MSIFRRDIDPDIIFVDAKNLPEFDVHQFEGKMEHPISRRAAVFFVISFVTIFGLFVFRLTNLQIVQGSNFAVKSENNTLRHVTIFSERGIITDRNGVALAWNEQGATSSSFAVRRYKDIPGLSHILGYVKYPAKDSSGNYYNTDYVPKAGAELFYNDKLNGTHGIQLTETDVRGNISSQSVLEPPIHGETVALSIDSRVQTLLYETMHENGNKVGFQGGAGAMIDLETGEIIAYAMYPEYSSETMTNGTQSEINKTLQDPSKPFIDRISTGLYTPGSIVKPFMSIAALNENIISPEKQILSTGSISLPNPYNPSNPSIFRDWKAHGWVDMRRAIAVSSDVYFYAVGGGFADQKGLGISRIDKYMHLFGFAEPMKSPFFVSSIGTVPTPEWKLENFDGDPWRVGDTYLTSIGQYGFQVTPIQVIRALAAVATKGTLIEPTILKGDESNKKLYGYIDIDPVYFDIAQEGMRGSVEYGTAAALNILPVAMAGKTGTAELGITKALVNSWVIGFYPYEKPKYAFVLLMEKGSRFNLFGASPIMSQFFQKLQTVAPEYISAN